jgi:hypothetical protein
MIPVKRYKADRYFLSLLGMIGFLLFTIQINYQYAEPGDTKDANDPGSVAVRVCCTIRGTVGEHLPVVVEAPVASGYPDRYPPIALSAGPSLRVSDVALPSLRGPPFCA